jgi:hypothetical protein
MVDWERGTVRVIPGALPRIADVRDGWALALETEPEPTFRRFRFTPPPGAP